MNFEEFKQTETYKAFSSYSNFVTAMLLSDPEGHGLSFSELEQITRGVFSGEPNKNKVEIDESIEYGFDEGDIDRNNRLRDGRIEKVYFLTDNGRLGIKPYIDHLAEVRASK